MGGTRARRGVPVQSLASGARGRCLLTHGGGRDAECGGHFLALFANFAVVALVLLVVSTTGTAAASSAAWIFRIDGTSRARREELWAMRSRMASAKVGSPIPSCHVSVGSWLVMSVEPRP